MQSISEEATIKRKPVNLTIREDVIREAKTLNLNASKAAEAGIYQAIQHAKAAQWRAQNKIAIEAYNAEIETKGSLLTPSWLES